MSYFFIPLASGNSDAMFPDTHLMRTDGNMVENLKVMCSNLLILRMTPSWKGAYASFGTEQA